MFIRLIIICDKEATKRYFSGFYGIHVFTQQVSEYEERPKKEEKNKFVRISVQLFGLFVYTQRAL